MKKNEKKKAKEEVGSENSAEQGAGDKKSLLKRLFSLKFIIIFALLIIIISGAGFAGWYFFLRKDASQPEETKIEEKAKDDKNQQPPPEPDFPDVVDFQPFEKIKLKEGETLNYLTLRISVELIKPEIRKDFETHTDRMRAIVESEIKKMSWLVLRSPEGKLEFKYHLIKELNAALPSRMVQNIYFTGFLLQ